MYPALVRSRARLDYGAVQEALDAGTAHPSVALLGEVGRARQASSKRRSAINLRLPSQRVERVEQGDHGERIARGEPDTSQTGTVYELQLDPRPASMDYNSEVSLLAGMVAGEMMARHGIGVLRVLAPAEPRDMEDFLVAARALGFAPPAPTLPGVARFLAEVDADSPRGMALMRDAARLLRGSGYVRCMEADPDQQPPHHAGVGGVYAHVTAPLRRLIDRYGLEYCLAIAAFERGETPEIQVPDWVEDTLSEAIESMRRSGSLASTVDRQCLNLTEAVVLEPWVGTSFDATVLHSKESAAEIFVESPPVIAKCRESAGAGQPPQGTRQVVTLIVADPTDPAAAEVAFAWPAD